MVVDKLAFVGHRAIGEAVRARVEHAVGLEEAAVIDLLAGRVLHRELDPGLVEIAHLGNQRVADVLVLNDDIGFDDVVGREVIGSLAERRDQLVVCSAFLRAKISTLR